VGIYGDGPVLDYADPGPSESLRQCDWIRIIWRGRSRVNKLWNCSKGINSP
jgi:hypothetical protein